MVVPVSSVRSREFVRRRPSWRSNRWCPDRQQQQQGWGHMVRVRLLYHQDSASPDHRDWLAHSLQRRPDHIRQPVHDGQLNRFRWVTHSARTGVRVSVRLRPHRHEYESGFAFTGCLSLVQASPARQAQISYCLTATQCMSIDVWQSPVKLSEWIVKVLHNVHRIVTGFTVHTPLVLMSNIVSWAHPAVMLIVWLCLILSVCVSVCL